MRSRISEITLIFRVEPFKIASKMNEVATKKSYDEISYSEIGLKYYNKTPDYKLFAPLIVVE